MIRTREAILVRGLWTLQVMLALGGLGILAETLFVPRLPGRIEIKMPPADDPTVLAPLPSGGKDGLINRRFTRRIAAQAATAEAPPPKAQDLPLEHLIKLTGILDFGGKQPTLAVIETPQDSKAYKAGDKVGETGVVVRDVKDYVVIEYERRRYRVTFKGIQELPAAAVGKD
ncbi:MAG TPA: hypothetical protein VKW04_05460 [Planctomycetota bacterium]|nr:hypothetical protein [Planctomycetota bacterium]